MKLDYIAGNTLQLLDSGAAYFNALEAAIDAAQHEIFLETYIYAGDATAKRITAALVAAARRSIAVHVLVDGFGARDMPPALRDDLQRAGVRFQVYGPDISPLTLRRRRLRRLHRKLCVIDACIAFAGGINVVDDYDEYCPGYPRYDMAVRVEGPLAQRVRTEMAGLWLRVARFHLNRRVLRLPPLPPPCRVGGDVAAALVVRDNLRHRQDIEQAYLQAMAAARTEIVLANAYFLPGLPFRQALMGAARRGVRVVLLLQSIGDHPLQTYASRAFYGVMLDAGVEIYEYTRSALHAKVAVIDQRWATVGSSNVDPFSLLLAREANIATADPRFAAALRATLEHAISAGATAVKPMEWRAQPWHRRVRIWLAYGLVRLMMKLAGYGQAR
ncbi:MAG: cardiolipin synthase ClsB [Gammaproteobacteria bacterium]